MIRILHLTDFHLNNKTLVDWNDFLKEIFLQKIKEIHESTPIDIILFTGDLIDKGGADFGSVTDGLNCFNTNIIIPILQELELDVSRLIICPGNHDINRNADEEHEEIGLKASLNSIEKINNFINKREKENTFGAIRRIEEYKCFEKELYKDTLLEKISNFKFSLKLNLENKCVGITSINSSWRCYGDNDKGNILIGEAQLQSNLNSIESCDIKIALLHHPLEYLAEVESQLIKNHISIGYDLIFTGHVHQTNVEFVENLAGASIRITSPSGLNLIRENDNNFSTGFSLIDYGTENVKCHFFKYNHNLKLFVANTDVCDQGTKEIIIHKSIEKSNKAQELILEDEFKEFLDDSGANFTHRGKELTFEDIYVAPFMEQYNLNEDEEKSATIKSTDVLQKIIDNEIKHTIILGDEKSGKTSFLKLTFKNILNEEANVPIFIEGREIKKVSKEDILKLIEKESKRQYKHKVDLTPQKLCIIIDDFDNCKLPLKNKRNFITNLYSLEFKTIVTWDQYFTLNELFESQTTIVNVYEILKFGGSKRSELIRRWIDLYDDEFDDIQSKEFEFKELVKIVNIVIGKNLIPSFPIYILTILQANELSNTTNFEQSTLGHYYDVLIRSALGNKIKANAEIEKYYSYLTEFSYSVYNKEGKDVDETMIMDFHKFFCEKYSITMSFTETISLLENSNLIQIKSNSYIFKYKYIYFYFIGKYLSDNIDNDDIKKVITELSKKLYQTESANIYIFLSHHSKSKFIIDKILERARESFEHESIIGFNSDISKINDLILATADKINYDQELTSTVKLEEDENIEELGSNVEEEIDSISKINKSFKTIEIIGYIIKNRYASLTGNEKSELIEELYKLGLRSITFLFRTLLEGEEYIKNEIIDLIRRDPRSALTNQEREHMAKQLMFNLLYMVSYSTLKRISSSISSRELQITFEKVRNKLEITQSGERNYAVLLIDMAVIFEYSKSFPSNDVQKLVQELKNNQLSFVVLRRLGINFLRMIPLREKEQQKASNMLNISIKSQRLISATSKIKKTK